VSPAASSILARLGEVRIRTGPELEPASGVPQSRGRHHARCPLLPPWGHERTQNMNLFERANVEHELHHIDASDDLCGDAAE
jgi:hypothetical protein